MANSFDSNFSRKLMEVFLDKFESERVLSKNVDTQLFAGKFNPSTGENIDVKRPTDFLTVRTPEGNVASETESDIITDHHDQNVTQRLEAFGDSPIISQCTHWGVV